MRGRERSVSLRRRIEKSAGDIRSANADMSNVKEGEKPSRRKPPFPALRSSERVSRPKVRPKGVADGNRVNIPGPLSDAKGVTERLRSSGCWTTRYLDEDGRQANPPTDRPDRKWCSHGSEVIGNSSRKNL